jgi:hypothetical protein
MVLSDDCSWFDHAISSDNVGLRVGAADGGLEWIRRVVWKAVGADVGDPEGCLDGCAVGRAIG